MRNAELGNGCVYWLKWRFPWRKNGLAGASGFRMAMAEKEATWVITKKEFFEPAKSAVFWQVLTITEKHRFRLIKTGAL
jgi:hypothetical protein